MTVELTLNSAQAVCAGTDQVSFYVFQFILIEFQLRFGQVDLLLEGVPVVLVLRTGSKLLLELKSILVLIGLSRPLPP